VGVLFMQLFFAVTGAAGSLAIVLRTAPTLLLFSTVSVYQHISFEVLVTACIQVTDAIISKPAIAAAACLTKLSECITDLHVCVADLERSGSNCSASNSVLNAAVSTLQCLLSTHTAIMRMLF
jgi:hypothetical protein